MPKLVRVLDDCYSALETMLKEIQKEKKLKGIRGKTTYGECVCRLLRETGRLV